MTFARYVLRTTDAPAARAFYMAALDLALPDGATPDSPLEAWPLHEQARARGAPPHWLGQLAVDNVDTAAARLVALGAARLGATVRGRDGAAFTVLRDPLGAIVGLRESAGASRHDGPVRWHQLHTRDLERAWSTYTGLYGWSDAGHIDVPDPEGGHRLFTWPGAAGAVGSVGNTARWRGVQPHWLFHFPVPDVAGVAAKVRALGGQARDPEALPDGSVLCACDDPQGAAFGLFQTG